MLNKTLWATAIGVVLFAGCLATRPPDAAAIKEADERMVAHCTYLGDVAGSSMMSNMAAERGRQNAKTGALKQAAELGATHVVWSTITSTSGGGSQANGKAYRCAE